VDDLVLLSMLHDIGKVGVDDRILNKPGRLTTGIRKDEEAFGNRSPHCALHTRA
jgi:response regulator RpfG family c-di-GMP phosphodiesterase